MFMVLVGVTSKVPMKFVAYLSAFGIGLILSVFMQTTATVLGIGFTKGILGSLRSQNITVEYKESRISTLGEGDAQRSKEH